MKQLIKNECHNIPKNQTQRLDRWLWASRFYKTRKLACDAANAGHIEVNKNKSKPGKGIKPGDMLKISRNNELFHLKILKLSTNRLSAPLATRLFEESEWSIQSRQDQKQQRKNNYQSVRYEHGKPTRRDRKRMLQIKNQTPCIE